MAEGLLFGHVEPDEILFMRRLLDHPDGSREPQGQFRDHGDRNQGQQKRDQPRQNGDGGALNR
jgi:hypothetical protein